MVEPVDPRFLAGEQAVLTDARDMALVIAVGWDNAVDIHANIAKPEAARILRLIADQFDPPAAPVGGGEATPSLADLPSLAKDGEQ